jgi:hypothetical protein
MSARERSKALIAERTACRAVQRAAAVPTANAEAHGAQAV